MLIESIFGEEGLNSHRTVIVFLNVFIYVSYIKGVPQNLYGILNS